MMASLLLLLILALSLPTIHGLSNNRHVCLFKKYSFVRGPHFNGLFDQLVEQTGFGEKRVAMLTIDGHGEPTDQLVSDLGLDAIEVFRLDETNPIDLEINFQKFDPTILWASDAHSALRLRYFMRTSGFDGLVENLCGSVDQRSLLYVGEGAGVICGGSHMALAKGQDPAREPQFRGLELLGSETSVSFDSAIHGLDGAITTLDEKQVYMWSQKNGEATSFVMSPRQKGAIESLFHPDPLPPLVETYVGGRRCAGEPSIDPSRMLQMGGDGDSEWFEG